MTREEAKRVLSCSSIQQFCLFKVCIDGKELSAKEALTMAIKALEQESCETIHGSTYGGVSWGGTYKLQQTSEDAINKLCKEN